MNIGERKLTHDLDTILPDIDLECKICGKEKEVRHHHCEHKDLITIESLAVMSQESKTHMKSSNTYLTGTVDLTDKISMLENMENTWHSQIKIITFTFFLLLFHTDKLEDDEAPDCRPVYSTQYTAGYTLSDQV